MVDIPRDETGWSGRKKGNMKDILKRKHLPAD